MQLRIRGARETSAAFHARAAAARDLSDAMRDLTKLIIPTARSLARRRTGAMATAIRPSISLTRASVQTGPQRYMSVQHHGSHVRGISPNRYLTDALTRRESDILRCLDNHLGHITKD